LKKPPPKGRFAPDVHPSEYWDSWRELNGLNESEAARDDKRDK
jgi:hypothetical protein